MARFSDNIPILTGSGPPAEILPLRRGMAGWIAEFAVLLLRAMVIVVLLSPFFMAAALLLR